MSVYIYMCVYIYIYVHTYIPYIYICRYRSFTLYPLRSLIPHVLSSSGVQS